jgi:hypothetical protein
MKADSKSNIARIAAAIDVELTTQQLFDND